MEYCHSGSIYDINAATVERYDKRAKSPGTEYLRKQNHKDLSERPLRGTMHSNDDRLRQWMHG